MRVGQRVSCAGVMFGGSAYEKAKTSWSWWRYGRAISGATARTYRVRPPDVGAKVRCVATARSGSVAIVAQSPMRLVLG
jgi:hypothetical protein